MKNEVSIRCDCLDGCTNLVLLKGSDGSYSFRFENSYLKSDRPSKLRHIWNTIKGKPTIYSEVWVGNADNLVNFLNEIMELVDA